MKGKRRSFLWSIFKCWTSNTSYGFFKCSHSFFVLFLERLIYDAECRAEHVSSDRRVMVSVRVWKDADGFNSEPRISSMLWPRGLKGKVLMVQNVKDENFLLGYLARWIKCSKVPTHICSTGHKQTLFPTFIVKTLWGWLFRSVTSVAAVRAVMLPAPAFIR